MTKTKQSGKAEPRKFVLLTRRVCQSWRLGYMQGSCHTTALLASGRTRCRECGDMIARGTPVIEFYQELPGGAFTYGETRMLIHYEDCGGDL